MSEVIIDKVAQYIEALAASLGVAAAHVYEVMARQKVTEGIVYSVLLPVIVVVATVAGVKLAKLTVKNWEELYRNDVEAPITVAWVFGGIAYLVLIIATIANLPEYVMKIYNPEYYVIREILGVIKGGS